ncbi:hypothetical protein SAMN03080599_00205 [Acidaminobacter hydrogenoformans DSM 2784]|uniref:Uncharacterized protein n=1 Tax=Acidaminobacter hydrogenoformans DSM 2784 TaxID=1120920 RepID=A0A1G5RQW1_9FIRM|nr:hypothetical protein SAMN03080599_00205 [Acidaminobacter hydrogenoformans DSM 2784]
MSSHLSLPNLAWIVTGNFKLCMLWKTLGEGMRKILNQIHLFIFLYLVPKNSFF